MKSKLAALALILASAINPAREFLLARFNKRAREIADGLAVGGLIVLVVGMLMLAAFYSPLCIPLAGVAYAAGIAREQAVAGEREKIAEQADAELYGGLTPEDKATVDQAERIIGDAQAGGPDPGDRIIGDAQAGGPDPGDRIIDVTLINAPHR